MKRVFVSALIAALLVVGASPAAFAQPRPTMPAPSKVEFTDYSVVIAQRGPNWKPQAESSGFDVRLEVIANLQKAFAQGEIITAGIVTDGSGAEFILLAEPADASALRQKLENSKHVKDGFYSLTIYDWRAPKGLKLDSVPLLK